MKHAKYESLRIKDFQTRFADQLLWPSIPVTAQRYCELIGMAVLKPREPLSIAASMLEQKNSSARLTNPAYLAQRFDWISERAATE